MNGQYKKDEKVIKDIIKQNVKPTNENEKIDVVIYYKNLKTKKPYNEEQHDQNSRPVDDVLDCVQIQMP